MYEQPEENDNGEPFEDIYLLSYIDSESKSFLHVKTIKKDNIWALTFYICYS